MVGLQEGDEPIGFEPELLELEPDELLKLVLLEPELLEPELADPLEPLWAWVWVDGFVEPGPKGS